MADFFPPLQKILAAVQCEARRSELRQLAEQNRFRPREVEARQPLNALLEFRRYFLAQRRIPVQRHEVETYVRPAGDHRAKEKRLAFIRGCFRLQIEAAARVRVDIQMLHVRRETPLRGKNAAAKLSARSTTSTAPARKVFFCVKTTLL